MAVQAEEDSDDAPLLPPPVEEACVCVLPTAGLLTVPSFDCQAVEPLIDHEAEAPVHAAEAPVPNLKV